MKIVKLAFTDVGKQTISLNSFQNFAFVFIQYRLTYIVWAQIM